MNSYFATTNKTNTVSSTVPMFNLLGAASRPLHIYEIMIACDAAPDDEAATFALMRTTARGTQSTTVAPNPLSTQSPASIATLDDTWSVDPTITANSQLLQFAMNQRATIRWVARPGNEIVVPATANAGLALVSVVATSPANFVFSISWTE